MTRYTLHIESRDHKTTYQVHSSDLRELRSFLKRYGPEARLVQLLGNDVVRRDHDVYYFLDTHHAGTAGEAFNRLKQGII